tara:strand:- start:13646 stop:14791 length:1146 start_codon:yes stop_codon:yes gene_type:complete
MMDKKKANFPAMKEKGNQDDPRGVLLVSARHIVFQSFDPVDGISPEEAEESALLSFEEELPFAVEQVATGVYSDDSGRVVIWGCSAAMLPEAGRDEFLFPEFFPLLGWDREPGSVELLEGNEGDCLVFFDEGGSLPNDIVGLPATESESELLAEIEAAFLFLERPFSGVDSFQKAKVEEVTADSSGKFSARVNVYGIEKRWTRVGESLWRADLRPTAQILQFRKEKKSAERIWKGAQFAAIFLLILILAQGGLWGLQHWVGKKEETRERQAPLVQAVEERANLAARLNDLGESRVSVFERLGDLNLVRPDGIQFLDVEFEEPDMFRIEGRVTNVRVLNDFISRLKEDFRFTVTDAPSPRTRNGRVEFELSVQVPNQKGGRG